MPVPQALKEQPEEQESKAPLPSVLVALLVQRVPQAIKE
jgi:hypothetical protein